ncbi:MAG: ferredoxin--nitrite reductase [Bacillota bacterium]|nr:ferredoxin--nitrite reductase [Bacillota bacterium]
MKKILVEQLDEKIEHAKELYSKEITEFKEIGHKFLNEEITSAQFKGTSGGIGVYAQRSQKEFMIRLRVLSGVLDYKTLKLIHDFAAEYSLDFVHLTTRQAIQLHDLQFDHIINIMEKSMDNNLFTRGGGGNFPRNVSLSPLSGVEKNEAFDVTPYAILVNKYFLSQMNTYKLPRKFKVAFSNSSEDSANASIADMGFLALKKDEKEYFKLYIGGSLGSNGDIAVPYGELISPKDILYHIEAALSLFKEEGDYENKGKARMRFIVKRMGKEAFLECYKKHLEKVKETQILDFVYKNDYQVKEANIEVTEVDKFDNNYDIIPQKQKNLYSVEIHPQGGLLKTKDLKNILMFIEKLSDVQIRLSMEESMFIRNLTKEQANELLEITKNFRNTTRLNRSVSCIGVPTCQIGIQNSQELLANILEYFKVKEFNEDILPSIHISGCANSCARHQVNIIGFQGKKKRINDEIIDAYSLYLNGNTNLENTRLANEYGDLIASDIPEFLYELAIRVKESKLEYSKFMNSNKEEIDSLLKKYIV